MSYGNNDTVIYFTEEGEFKTIGIIGDNGKGKTSIYDAIFLALFDTPYRKLNKSDIVNRDNKKDAYVAIEFLNNGKHYIIERGINPTFVKITCDNVEQKLDAHSRDIQKLIETQIIGVNEKIFRLIFMVGIGMFTSFFELGIEERRVIFEFILGINVLSVMLEKTKKKNTKVNNEIEDLKRQIERQVELKDVYIKKIEDINNINKTTDFKKEIKELQKNIELNQKALSKINITEIESKQKTLSEKLKTIQKEKEEVISSIRENKLLSSQHKEMLEFFMNNDFCPVCTQPISEGFKKSKIEQEDKAINVNKKNKAKLKKKEDLITDSIEDTLEEINGVVDELRTKESIESEIKNITKTIEQYKKKETKNTKDTQVVIEEIQQQIKDKKKEIKELANRGNSLSTESYYNGIMVDILGDKGIKKYVYTIILKKINRYINEYISQFSSNMRVCITPDLKSFFYERKGDNIQYKSFSNGEKLVANFSFIFGTLRFLEDFYGFKSNFLFFDEILDTSLDSKNKRFLIETLEKFEKNIIIISHDHELSSIFNECYLIDKEDGFSVMDKFNS